MYFIVVAIDEIRNGVLPLGKRLDISYRLVDPAPKHSAAHGRFAVVQHMQQAIVVAAHQILAQLEVSSCGSIQ